MKKILCSMLTVTLLYSCSNSDDSYTTVDSDNTFLNGYFVTNEGNFNKGNAAVSYISNDLNNITNTIFKSANNRSLGDVAQSLVVTDKYVFVVVNNSNTIEVVNKKTFKSVYTITQGLSSPRYAVIKNNKLYVTSLNKASVNVYNAETFALIKEIPLNATAEQIVTSGDYIYAANGYYSGSTLVEVINSIDDTNTVDINMHAAITNITANAENVYALTANETFSKISMIKNTTIENIEDLKQVNARHIVADGGYVYYTAGTGVYRINALLGTDATKLFDVTVGDQYSILYGFNILDGKIFTSDANDYTQNCKVTIYNTNGSIIKELTAGIGTNGFYKY